eukprot:gene11421-12611_t
MAIILQQRLLTLKSFLLAATYLFSELTTSRARVRSCKRLPRNTGWWEKLWFIYDDKRFKQTLRVSRSTFEFILTRIRPQLERQMLTEEPISPELHLAICLYRLGRGDYLHSIGEMVGLARSTVTRIVNEVTQVIVFCLWEQFVSNNMPKTEDEFQSKILNMKELWQFWQIVLMALVDAKYRFILGSCGFPGNSHDSEWHKVIRIFSQWKKYRPMWPQDDPINHDKLSLCTYVEPKIEHNGRADITRRNSLQNRLETKIVLHFDTNGL